MLDCYLKGMRLNEHFKPKSVGKLQKGVENLSVMKETEYRTREVIIDQSLLKKGIKICKNSKFIIHIASIHVKIT